MDDRRAISGWWSLGLSGEAPLLIKVFLVANLGMAIVSLSELDSHVRVFGVMLEGKPAVTVEALHLLAFLFMVVGIARRSLLAAKFYILAVVYYSGLVAANFQVGQVSGAPVPWYFAAGVVVVLVGFSVPLALHQEYFRR